MAYEPKNNVLILHKNKYKTADKHPDFKGSVVVEGVKKDASMWMNKNKNGDEYVRCTLDEPYIKTDTTSPPVFETTSEDVPY